MNWNYPKPGDYTQYFTPVCYAPSARLSGLPGHRQLWMIWSWRRTNRSFEVERLLRWRWKGPSGKRHREYLVLWAGYSVDDASWTPAGNFDYPKELQKMIERDNPVEDTAVL